LQLWQDRRAVGEAVAVQERAQPGRQVRERAESCLGEQARPGQRHEGPRRRDEVGYRASRLGGVPVDERDRYPVPVDGVPRAQVAVADDLPRSWRPRTGTVAGDARPEADGRLVQFADQPSRGAQRQIGPGIGWQPVPVPRLPARVVGDVAVDEGQDFPVAFNPQQPGSAAETGCLQMPQVFVDGGRSWSHRPQQPVAAPCHPAGHPPAGDRHLARPRPLVARHQTSIATTGASASTASAGSRSRRVSNDPPFSRSASAELRLERIAVRHDWIQPQPTPALLPEGTSGPPAVWRQRRPGRATHVPCTSGTLVWFAAGRQAVMATAMSPGPGVRRNDCRVPVTGRHAMTNDTVNATMIIDAPAEAIFAVLADPANHAAIDGTGWVRESLGGQRLTAAGQVFRMAMYHPNHPDGNYRMANRVQVFDPPHAIAWEPGQDSGDGGLRFGGWVWRYDLAPAGPSRTAVTLSYDWSAVGDALRQHIRFPPFPPDHLDNSLAHLAGLAVS
jgi:uncharacterized protein YndB with AHSA1/START domain